MSRSSDQVRREFIGFFEDRGHTFVPPSSLLPADDPTLLFTNAGMNQFKDVFLGTGTRPYKRAVNSQKCIRAGGKHNDLEDVGHDTCHQTFFEMLGNWSFGDYFKAEAIQWAWELLTGVWGFPKDQLWATVFGGDEPAGLPGDTESTELWPRVTDLPAERVLKFDIHENFWEMADTGPCGVNTEIHIDLGEGTCDGSRHAAKACGINVEGCGRFVELWNLVFIQFNRDEAGALEALPAKHVDTGLGFERVCAVLRGSTSNYEADVFSPLMAWLEQRCGCHYGDAHETDVAFRVVADHARACSFAIADGVLPSNEGRGYVIRRILRRAARFGRKLRQHEPFLHLLVPVIVRQMGKVFPEIARRQEQVVQTIREEEVSFNRTLDRGLEVFERVAAKADRQIGGEVAFELYATYGFPIDLTQLMAAERGLTVDMEGYEEEMARHREISAAGAAFQTAAITGVPETDDSAKYEADTVEAKVLGWVIGENYAAEGTLDTGVEAAVVLDRTNFYGESGGQVGDVGRLVWPQGAFAVRDTKLAGHCVLHVGAVEKGMLSAGQAVTAEVNPVRADTKRNHTATHLLNWALRKVLGPHVEQAGSVVEPTRLRFDFTHNEAVTGEQLVEVEQLVNERILADEPVHATWIPLAQARRITGVQAVFGEKYPDPVRVISIGAADPLRQADGTVPVEFCGGTHLERTGQAGFFKVISEESVARGVRRITAVTGHEAVRYVQRLDEAARLASAVLRVPVEQVPERVAALQKEVKQLKKRPGAGAPAFQPDFVVDTPDGKVLVGQTEVTSPSAMRKLCDVERQKGAAAMLVAAVDEGKVTLIAMVTEALAKAGKARADEWLRAVAEVVGGGGGGRPTMAQAGGRDPERLPEALQVARDWIRQRLGGTG